MLETPFSSSENKKREKLESVLMKNAGVVMLSIIKNNSKKNKPSMKRRKLNARSIQKMKQRRAMNSTKRNMDNG
jgi:hypothetical protein